MSKPVIKRTYVHWRGSFVAIGGTVWEVEILRPEKVLTPVELDFPADEPLIIEWDDITPESTVTGSTATLKVISSRERDIIRSLAPSQSLEQRVQRLCDRHAPLPRISCETFMRLKRNTRGKRLLAARHSLPSSTRASTPATRFFHCFIHNSRNLY